jgi:cyclopropane fatty-acyl-phospholipid synthase-like methyltransferase
MLHRLFFEARYLLGRPPWDTGITPPEVTAFLDARPTGRALDIGCGTGTNAVTMARRGWTVTAIDLSRVALRSARRKARAAGLTIDFRRADAGTLLGIQGPFDFALDIGCYHSLAPAGRAGYAARLPELVAAQGVFILFSFLGDPAEPHWPEQGEITRAFETAFRLERLDTGTTSWRPSAYFTWVRWA